MIYRNNKTIIGILFLATLCFVLGTKVNCSETDSPPAQTSDTAIFSPQIQPQSEPMIIWFHNSATTKPEYLDKALSSGIITHALLLYLHPLDAPLKGKVLNKVSKEVAICKKYNVKVIWCRTLWPTYQVKDISFNDLFDANYYSKSIEILKQEKAVLKADYIAFDTEVYGSVPFKSLVHKPWKTEQLKHITEAIKTATNKTGQMDYVLPSYGSFKNHYYNAVVYLGKIKIAEHTYYDIPKKIADKNRPYDIIGLYINSKKENPKVPQAPYFTVEEIYKRRDLWKDKKGVMLYPLESQVEQIAEILSKTKKEPSDGGKIKE